MKISKRLSEGRVTVTRTVTLYPEQDQKLIAADESRNRSDPHRRSSISEIMQELIDKSLDSATGRAKDSMIARDNAFSFEEDVMVVLVGDGRKVEQNVACKGTTHRVDYLITGPKGQCIVLLKSSSKWDRLEMALGIALTLKSQTKLPVAVCVPILLSSTIGAVFEMAKVSLIEASQLAKWVADTVG